MNVVVIIPIADPASLEIYATIADAIAESPVLEDRTESEFAGVTTVRVAWRGTDFIVARKRVRSA
jgi:hypothetical protein